MKGSVEQKGEADTLIQDKIKLISQREIHSLCFESELKANANCHIPLWY